MGLLTLLDFLLERGLVFEYVCWGLGYGDEGFREFEFRDKALFRFKDANACHM